MKAETVKRIKEIFIDMLLEMPLDKITVIELCARAQINRGTFYRYFPDVYAVLEDLENELLAKAPIYAQDMSGKEFLKLYLTFLRRHSRLLAAIFSHTFYRSFAEKLTKKTALSTMAILKATAEMEHEIYASGIAAYAFAGNLGLIISWLKGELALSIDEMAELICQINVWGTQGILGK